MIKFQIAIAVGEMEHYYHIIDKNGNLSVQKDGRWVAAFEENESWQQVSGAPIPKEIFKRLIYKLDMYFSSASRANNVKKIL